jgi:hypothetical protein
MTAMDPLGQPPRQNLRKTGSATPSGQANRQAPPAADDLSLDPEDIRARAQSLRRGTSREPERGGVGAVAGAVGTAAAGLVEGTIARILRLVQWPLMIVIGVWVAFTVGGWLGVLVGVGATFGLGFLFGVVLRWLDLRAYRRQVD